MSAPDPALLGFLSLQVRLPTRHHAAVPSDSKPPALRMARTRRPALLRFFSQFTPPTTWPTLWRFEVLADPPSIPLPQELPPAVGVQWELPAAVARRDQRHALGLILNPGSWTGILSGRGVFHALFRIPSTRLFRGACRRRRAHVTAPTWSGPSLGAPQLALRPYRGASD
jgi:hypothetical protein